MISPASQDAIAQAAKLLASGCLVGLPTETVYGLAANAWDAGAVQKIFVAKSRPSSNPLIVHVASVDRLRDAISWPPPPLVRDQLAAISDLWPGPLTVVCERNDRISDQVTAGQSTVAVRIPAHEVALSLLDKCVFPLAAPSANRSKYVSPTLAEHLCGPTGIEEHLSMILDGGPCHWGVESTIVKLGSEIPQLLRPGAVPLAELAERFGIHPEAMLQSTAERHQRAPCDDETPWLSPGMMREHYSPSTPLRLVDHSLATTYQFANQRVGRIAFVPLSKSEAGRFAAVEILSATGDLREVAHHLFAALRRMDDEGLDLILCDTCVPVDLGLAIMDRLHRAAARTLS